MTTVEHRFRPSGGQSVPETLMPALDRARAGRGCGARGCRVQGRADGLLRDFVGRPSPLYLAERLSERWWASTVWLEREDLNHTGAHGINNALGQGLLAQRMGKRRDHRRDRGRAAWRGHGRPPCALLDLECVVYMGTEDIAPPAAQRSCG